jgi:hypothetical protein
MKLRLACAFAVAAALIGCGEQAVDPDPYGLSKVTPDPNFTPPSSDPAGTLQGGPGQPSAGGMPKGYPAPKNQAPAAEAPPTDEAPKAEPPAAEPAKTDGEGLTQEEIDEIKKLPADEQAQALAQVVCVISGEHLGSMGTPVKVESEGKTAFLCCKGCLEDFEKDPKAAMAKLEKK